MHVRNFFKIVVPTFLFITQFAVLTFAQTHNFLNYSVENGMPFITPNTLFQDSKGYLWTGGYGGLSRFDGKNFYNYSPKDGLSNHGVTAITEDSSANLWIGTINGLNKFNGRSFVTYTKADGLPGNYIRDLFVDKKNNLWIANNNGLGCYCEGKFKTYTTREGLLTNRINTFCNAKPEGIYIATDSGLSYFNKGVFKNYTVKDGLINNTIKSLTVDNNGVLWIGTNKGLSSFDNYKFTVYPNLKGVSDNVINKIIVDRDNALYIATDSNGLVKFDGQKLKKYNLRSKVNDCTISCFYRDYEDNIWIGTDNGIYKYRGDAFVCYNELDGFAKNEIYPIFRDRRNTLWIGTKDGLYTLVNNKLLRCKELDKLGATLVLALIEDHSGNLLIGTDNSVIQYDGKSFKKLSIPELYPTDHVAQILEDRKHNLWLGIKNAVIKYNGKSSERMQLNKVIENNKVYVYALAEDKAGTIWIGSYLGGLFAYNGKTLERKNNWLGYKGNNYMSIFTDKDDRIYFATFDGIYINDHGKSIHFSEKNGLRSDLIYVAGLANNDNDLWICTNQGVNKLDLKTYYSTGEKRIQFYEKTDGFIGVESNTNAFYKDKDEVLWFGTIKGLMRYDPKAFYENTSESKTSITGFKLFYKDTLLSQHAVLNAYDNNITFEYIGICLTNPSKVKYTYILEGFDNGWSPPTQSTSAKYANLPPGMYTFKVKSCNNEGKWNTAPVIFSFSIKPPFWNRGWFYTLIVFILFLVGYAILKYRENLVKRKEEVRTKMADNELKVLRAQMNPHFIFNALNSIQHFIINRDEDGATKYLNKFAKLIRSILHNTENATISLKEEIDGLKLYIELEVLRFENKFDYTVYVENDLDFYEIPTMLIQPYVENAILHGLVPKKQKGRLEVRVTLVNDFIVCTITDDGIGRKAAEQDYSLVKKAGHKSMAMKITHDRLELLNNIHHSALSVNITDLVDANGQPCGTKVELFIPVK